MADILTEIVEKRKADIERLGITFGFEIPEVRKRPVHKFLCNKGVILEVKRASPSKGDIAPDLDAVETAKSYEAAGAAAISCLTETNFFKGTLGDLMAICNAVDIAVLRKDFLINDEEVEIAYRAGADAVLLIARILEADMMIKMAKAAEAHKMTSLVEVRSDDDIQKLSVLVNAFNESNYDKQLIVCGVNSRDLATFKIDLLKPCALLGKIRGILGEDARVIFESGIRTPQAANFAGSLGFAGMLLGEAAAKAPELRGELVKAFVGAKPNKNAEFWGNTPHVGSVLVKICGLTRGQDLLLADSLGADFVGFIFAAGFARNVCDGRFEKMLPELKKVKAKKVAVITDPDSPEAQAAARYVEEGILDCIQLHGIAYEKVPARLLALPHYFAITEKNGPLAQAADNLFLMGEPSFLQDSKSQEYSTKHKLWLAGGVTPENAAELAARFQPELIDVS
ncbi:MAG: bifunctional indole-3-glycerol phosphate synthase/phosphoribosylanthranilate isomerase, partial [Treponema sp.]|nr:bifunctional indole-3-glycerol phosphate synthase/phosphoribosylanthranilate isomerase [Treponema sp.]